MPRSSSQTTTARGLGWDHQRQRAALLRAHRDGTACAVCGRPMYRTQDLDADHTTPRSQGGTKADRLLHSTCNRSRGDGKREQGDRERWTSRAW